MFDEYKYAYYQTLRTEARSRVVDALNRRIRSPNDRETWKGITLASIDHEALEYARVEWPKYYDGENFVSLPVSWERLYYKFLAMPSNYNIAVWQANEQHKILRGLALGKRSRGKTHLTINWIERSYEAPYFRGGVLLPILACAEEYGKLLGVERVLIKDAIDPSAFEKYGYAPYKDAPKGAIYLSKELDHG